MKRVWLALVICTALGFGTAASAQTASNGALTSNLVFEKNCAKCHGKSADGRHFAGPSLKNEKVASTSNADLQAIITNGKGHMPKFGGKLTSDEISNLVDQIKALK